MEYSQSNDLTIRKDAYIYLIKLTISLLIFFSISSNSFSQLNPPTFINVGGTGTSGLTMRVSWTYMSPYTTYKIYRSNSPSGTFNLIATKTGVVNSSFANYLDTNILPTTQYCYKVQTCVTNGSQCSNMSWSACATSPNTTPTFYTISGHVKDNSNNGVQGVTISLGSTGLQATTNSQGYYIINKATSSGLNNLTPYKSGYTFTPTSRPVNNLTQNLSGQDFTAYGGSSGGLSAPTLTATSNSTTTINLSWTSVTNATHYRVFSYSSSSNSYIPVTTYLQTTSTQRTNLTPNTQYCYAVVACSSTTSSACSNYSTVVCATTQNNNTTYSISGNTKDQSNNAIPYVTVNFIAGTGFSNLQSTTTNASGQFSISNVPSGWTGTITASKSNYTFNSVSINSISQNLTNQNLIGNTSGGGSLNSPTLNSPSNYANNVSTPVNFSWSSVTGATEYRILVSTSPNGWTNTNGFPTPVLNDVSYGNTYYQWSGAQTGTTYYWCVRAGNSSQGSLYSNYGQFTTSSGSNPLPTPNPTSPSNYSNNVSLPVNFSWYSVIGANNYNLQIATSTNGWNNSTGFSKSFVILDQNISSNNYTWNSAQNGTTYYWSVNATNSTQASKYSNIYSFTTVQGSSGINSPILIQPTQNAVDLTKPIVFKWSVVSNANSYRIQIATSNSGWSNSGFNSSYIIKDTTISSLTNYTWWGGIYSNTYFWSVQAIGNSESSNFSGITSFSLKDNTKTDIKIDLLTIYANSIVNMGNNIYQATGNVSINNLLFFDGDVGIDLNTTDISGNCQVYLDNIYGFGKVVLHEGAFKLNVQDEFLTAATFQLNKYFKLADLPVNIENIELLNDGVEINGKLKFPAIMGHLETEIDTVQLTISSGLDVTGKTTLKNVSLLSNSFKIKELSLEYNTIQNNFFGYGYLKTPYFDLESSADIISGQLNEIKVMVEPAKPVPIPGTGFSIKQGTGYVGGIKTPPLILSLGADLTPTIQGSYDIVKLDDLNLTYTWGQEFRGSGNVSLFDKPLAQVYLGINSERIEIGGDINLYDYLIGHNSLALYWGGNNIELHGKLLGTLQIPDNDGFLYELIECRYDLPIVLASTENYLKNTTIAGNSALGRLRFNYMMEWKYDKFKFSIGRGHKNWNSKLFNDRSHVLQYDALAMAQDHLEGRSLILNKNIYRDNDSTYNETFTLSTSTPTLMFRVIDSTSLPVYYLKLPDGTTITPKNVDQYSWISYEINTEKSRSFYVIDNPPQGDWEIKIKKGTANMYLDVVGENLKPFIRIDTVERKANKQFEIKWQDSDPDKNGQISLYYDDDNLDANGVLIAKNISEDDLTNKHVWNAQNIKSGNYYIYGVLEDDENTPVISYTKHPVKIIASNAPNAPLNLTFLAHDDSITLFWTHTTTKQVRYNIYYTDDNTEPNFRSSSLNAGNKKSYTIRDFIPGKIYKFLVTAIDENDLESDYSNTITIPFYSGSVNNAPLIISKQIPRSTFVDSLYEYKLNCYDYDGDLLIYRLLQAPFGMTINNEGKIIWVPSKNAIGTHKVTVEVSDIHGLTDHKTYYVLCYDFTRLDIQAEFNKPNYSSYGSYKAFVQIIDKYLNNNPAQIDTVYCTVYSKANPVGIQLKAIESEPNSNIYLGVFGFDKNKTNSTLLEVKNSDSLWVDYTNSVLNYSLIGRSSFGNQPFKVPVTIHGNTELKSGDSVVLEAAVGYVAYLWQDGKTSTRSLTVKKPGIYYVKALKHNGDAGYSDSITITSSTSINNVFKNNYQISIYPNPTDEDIMINFYSDCSQLINFSIYNILGKEILNNSFKVIKGDNIEMLEIKSLSKGVYFMKLEASNFSKTIKIYKK
jgi:hypothetical protein